MKAQAKVSPPKVGILRFLGTNCDRDVWQAVESVGLKPEWLWHEDHFEAKDYSALILPGGFSYGDYLRCGALAARSPVMQSLRQAVSRGVPVLGICNGFQILCESGLLPGALLPNQGGRFIDDWVELTLENSKADWAPQAVGSSIRLPIAHGDGRYFIQEEGLKRIEDQGQIWWRYKSNPNGSVADIAGVSDESGRVVGLMPHPERALWDWMGGVDGRGFFI